MTSTDPATVPDWPSPTVQLRADGTVQVDGISIPVPQHLPEDQVRRWAVTHVAAQYKRLGRPIRVTAVDPDGTTYPLIVHADGTTSEAAPIDGPRRRGLLPRARTAPRTPGKAAPGKPGPRDASRTRGLIAAGGFLGGVALIAAVVVVIASSGGAHDTSQAPQQPTAAASTSPPGPAELPVPAPVGFTTHGAWAVSLAPASTPALAADGSAVAAFTANNHLAVLDPATGVVRWSTTLPAGATGTLTVSTVDGTAVVTQLTSEALYYWPLTGDQHPVTAVTLPSQAQVSYLGPSPLVSLPDQTAAVLTHGALRQLDIPVGDTALAADGTTVTAASAAGTWTQLSPGHPATPAKTMAPPAKAARLLRVSGIDGQRLVGVWADTTGEQHATVYATATGQQLATATAPTGLDQASVCASGDLVVLGDLVLDTSTHTARNGVTATSCAAATGRLYVQDDTGTWYDTSAATDTPLPSGAAAPIGIADGRALVVADKLDQHLLYALNPGANSGASGGATVSTPTAAGQ